MSNRVITEFDRRALPFQTKKGKWVYAYSVDFRWDGEERSFVIFAQDNEDALDQLAHIQHLDADVKQILAINPSNSKWGAIKMWAGIIYRHIFYKK